MDIQEIAQKSLNGENVSEFIKDFDEAKKIELNKTIKTLSDEEAQKALDKLKGIRQEVSRKETQDSEAEKRIEANLTTKVRAPALESAKNQITKDLTPEDIAKVEETFKRLDDGIVGTELSGYKKALVATFPEKFIEAEKAKKDFEAQAAAFNSGSTAGSSSGGAGGMQKNYSPQAYRLVQEAQKKNMPLNLDEAEKALSSGNGWKDLPTL